MKPKYMTVQELKKTRFQRAAWLLVECIEHLYDDLSSDPTEERARDRVANQCCTLINLWTTDLMVKPEVQENESSE